MSHYYDFDESLESAPTEINYDFKGIHLTYKGDRGVFSKNRLDYGSRVLMDTVEVGSAKSMLDVGCGYGTMGIALKAVNPELDVTMIDINKRAVSLANENIKCNNLVGIVARVSNIYEDVDGTYDLIISNPPIRAGKNVVSAIISESYEYLNKGGRLVIVIQKKQGAPSAKKLMEKIFDQTEILKRDKGYYILQATK